VIVAEFILRAGSHPYTSRTQAAALFWLRKTLEFAPHHRLPETSLLIRREVEVVSDPAKSAPAGIPATLLPFPKLFR
jgi:hypothetical protein